MKNDELRSIQSQIAQVTKLLSKMGAGDVFARAGFESRLKELTARLAVERPFKFESRLTFNGLPVVGSHGISAFFGAKAIAAFSEAVSAIGASLRGNLSAKGPVTDRADFDMLITGTARGSFGFDLESRNASLIEGGAVQEAVERAQIVLEASIKEADEELAEAVVDLDRRALVAVRNFTEIMAQNGAYCTVMTDRRTFSFANSMEVAVSSARLSEENIVEEEMELVGALIGVLPESRNAEFRDGSGAILKGKVERSVGDLSGWNEFLDKVGTIACRITTVGDGKPKYLFISAPRPTGGAQLSLPPS